MAPKSVIYLFALVAIGLVAVGIQATAIGFKISVSGVPAFGTVVKITPHTVSSGRHSSPAAIAIVQLAGERWRDNPFVKVDTLFNYDEVHLGDTLSLLILESDPRRVVVASFFGVWGTGAFFTAFGLLFGSVALVQFRRFATAGR